jgi:Putative zinc-finger
MQDIPQIVLNRLQAAAEETHPDADLLTAFAEHSLAQPERAFVMQHLARCSGCRQIISFALCGDEAGAGGAAVPAHTNWLAWPVLRWVSATAAVLLLLSIGVMRYEQRQSHEEAMVASSSSTQTAATETQRYSPSQETSEVMAPRQPAEVQAEARKRPADAGRGGTQRMRSEQLLTARNQPQNQLIQLQALQPYQSFSNSDVVKAKAAVTTPASSSAAAAVSPPSIPLQTAPSLMTRASPRWSITADGGLQRSFDAGQTWENVNVMPGAQAQPEPVFRVVTAIGPEVWAGGSGLYHSSDSGTRWQQVFPSATGATAAGDITDIQFSIPQEVKIATSKDETWTTSDNGRTWRKQQ